MRQKDHFLRRLRRWLCKHGLLPIFGHQRYIAVKHNGLVPWPESSHWMCDKCQR